MIDVCSDDAARAEVMRQSLADFLEVSLAISEHHEDPTEMHAEGDIHVAVFVEIGGHDAAVIHAARPLYRAPEFPVTFAVAQKNRRHQAALALRRRDDVRAAVVVDRKSTRLNSSH